MLASSNFHRSIRSILDVSRGCVIQAQRQGPGFATSICPSMKSTVDRTKSTSIARSPQYASTHSMYTHMINQKRFKSDAKFPTPSSDPSVYRAFNFSAGPACLPNDVMNEAQRDFTNWRGTGMGIMEMSHRDVGGPVQSYIAQATDDMRKLLQVPDNYHVLWFQGGAHAQFAAIPLNLIGNKTHANYVKTGFWSQRAIDEASKYCKIHIAANAEDYNYDTIPPVSEWNIRDDAAYTHICANETIHGLEYLEDPDYPADAPPLVIDTTSTLLSRPMNVSKYGVIYASGGKNVGPAGSVAVIVRDDLLHIGAHQHTPSVLDWKKMASSTPIPSIYNTPPSFLLYMTSLVLQRIVDIGGLSAMQTNAKRRADLLYEIIDRSNGFYINNVDPVYRSRMNVPFRIQGGADVEKQFTVEAEQAGLFQVFGHPLFGGQRITLYNNVPDAAVDHVAQFMQQFQDSRTCT
jgi:phosphoserine aminotransferase